MAQLASILVPATKAVIGYMNNVQAALPDLDIGVIVGTPTGEYLPGTNQLRLGSFVNGGTNIATGYASQWRGMNGGSMVGMSRNLPLSITWAVVAWAADDGGDPVNSPILENLDTLWNYMQAQFLGDIGIEALNGIASSAQWEQINGAFTFYGPPDTGGIAAVIEASTTIKATGAA